MKGDYSLEQSMRNQSSETNEKLLKASELFDGRCHQLSSEDLKSFESVEVREHLKNWALIGSALRDEMPQKVDFNFADKVMAAIDEQDKAWVPPYESEDNFDQSSLQQDVNETGKVKLAMPTIALKKAGTVLIQTAVAATVATVAVIGMQVYNASNVQMDNIATTASNNVGPVNGLNLAAFQTNESDIVSLNNNVNDSAKPTPPADKTDLSKVRQEELDKVNSYVQGFITETASR